MVDDKSSQSTLPFSARTVRAHLRSGVRGETRLTEFLAQRLASLHSVPISIADFAPVYVDLRMRSSINLLKGTPHEKPPWEEDEQSAMRRFVREGDVVFDIGANIGLHTVLLSKLVGAKGKVFAFEPNTELLPNLERTVSGLNNATLHSIALSNQSTQSTLFVPEDDTMASLSAEYMPDTRAIVCEQRRMDDLIDEKILPRPDFIKCDVEGAELSVFEGARKTLEHAEAPVVLFEINVWSANSFNLSVGDAKYFLAALESPLYKFFELKENELRRVETIDAQYSNVLAIPQSKINRWPEFAIADRVPL